MIARVREICYRWTKWKYFRRNFFTFYRKRIDLICQKDVSGFLFLFLFRLRLFNSIANSPKSRWCQELKCERKRENREKNCFHATKIIFECFTIRNACRLCRYCLRLARIARASRRWNQTKIVKTSDRAEIVMCAIISNGSTYSLSSSTVVRATHIFAHLWSAMKRTSKRKRNEKW